MSLALHELLVCCRGLEQEKANDRKKEVEKFKRLINSADTVEQLDQNSDSRQSKHSKQLNWDAVFRVLQRYIQKETECIQSGKANVSATTQANRQKKMQEISSLVKYFIRCANKRGPRLKCAELLSHVMNILQNSYTCSAYGADYSSILLKDILSVRKYWCEINQKQWADLLELYCKLYRKSCKDIDRVLLARIIFTLVRGCCLQTEGVTHSLFNFFSKSLPEARNENILAVLEHIVGALNVFLRTSARNCRRRVCALGEEILPTIMYVWSQRRPQDHLKEEMVEFVSIQLHVHHPKGAKTEETGAYADDWSKWQSLLYSLYDAIGSELNQIGSRGKYSSGSRPIAVKENIVELMADICHQLFTEDSRILEIAQSTTQRETHQGVANKRRRIDIGWEVIQDKLQISQSDFDIIPWLQITSVLVSKYPSILPNKEIIPLLTALHQILIQQRRGEKTSYVIECLSKIASCQSIKKDLTFSQKPELIKIWTKIWMLTLHCVSSPQVEIQSFVLLQSIMKGTLIPMDKEFWKLFYGSACKQSYAAAQCLAQALTKYTIPEWLEIGPKYASSFEGNAPLSVRDTIMRWLLLNQMEEDTEELITTHPIVCKDFPHHIVPRILVSLMLKDSRGGMELFKCSDIFESFFPNKVDIMDVEILDYESLFLHSTFDKVPCCFSVEENVDKQSTTSVHLITGLKEKLEQYLLIVAERLLNSFFPNSQSPQAECLLRCVSLLTGVLSCYIIVGVVTEEDACKTILFQKSKSLIQHVSEYISTLKAKVADESSIASLKILLAQFLNCLCKQSKNCVNLIAICLFLRLLPSRLLNELSDICKVLITRKYEPSMTIQVPDDVNVSRMQINNQVDQDLFDDDDCCSRTTDLSEINDNVDLQCGTGANNALSEEHLTKQDSVYLDALKFLCLCTSSESIHGLCFRPVDIRRKLLSFIDPLDNTKPVHLHTYLILLRNLPEEDTTLTAEDFDSILKPLPDICSYYRRDQEICTVLLLAILPVIRSLSCDQSNAKEMGDVHGAFLKVLSAFWTLSKDGRSTASVRAALAKCMIALLEGDSQCHWSIFNMADEDIPISDAFPQFLADSDHEVRVLTAMSVNRLFLEFTPKGCGKMKLLPLTLQQKAFENVYLKAQEGIGFQKRFMADEFEDEQFNRKATLLKVIYVVLCCSPVCEKQALFALFQSFKENKIDLRLIKKVLSPVSKFLNYRNVKHLISSHLDYLVTEWLRQKDDGYSLQAFPYALLEFSTLDEFYRSCYNILVPHLVFLEDFEQVKAIGKRIEKDWKELLADCFPKIMVNILPCFAIKKNEVGQQREKASKVYDILQEDICLGKQKIDILIHNNLPEIVVELLMTLYEGANQEPREEDLSKFVGELDPAPNPPCFPSYVIKATLDYLTKCHSPNYKSLVTILSKNPISIQKILFSICKQSSETTNIYEKHRILLMYRLFVNLLLDELKDGLGGAWAFVLRDMIYTLIHHINSRPAHLDEVSTRSFSLCCDLLSSICQNALKYCGNALENHLQVIVGTLTPTVNEQTAVRQQVLRLLRFLVIEGKENENLYNAVRMLEPFPDVPLFKELRAAQHQVKYSRGPFTLEEEIKHFLSVSSCDSLPITRLEGLIDLKKQLQLHKEQMRELLKESQVDPQDSILLKLIRKLLQLCKTAVGHSGSRDILEAAGSCLGEVGPVDFATVALFHNKDYLNSKAEDLFQEKEFQWLYVILHSINNALTDRNIEVRLAAVTCLKNILNTKTGINFWERHRKNDDHILVYFSIFKTSKKKALEVSVGNVMDPTDTLSKTDLWVPQNGCHNSWLRNLTLALLKSDGVKNEVLMLLDPLCSVKTEFCQTILPFLIHDILLHDTDNFWRNLLSKQIQAFFSTCSKASSVSSRSTTPANMDSEAESVTYGHLDKASLRTMLAVVDNLRRQNRSIQGSACGTVFDNSFWLELNYFEVAIAAQSCAADFTALLYSEIYVDKIRSDYEDSQRNASKVSRRILFEESSQSFTITSLSEKSREETGKSLQDLLIEVYRRIGEPDSLYGCGGGKMLHPSTRISTYEHEAMWGKALVSYDLHTSLPSVTRQAGIIQALQNFGLCNTLLTYLKGLEYENTDWGTELQEIRFQAAWRNMQWDYTPSARDETVAPGYHESLHSALQSLQHKEISAFHDNLKYARVHEVETLCKESLESVCFLYPTLCNLQQISELESIGHVFSRTVTEAMLSNVYNNWQQQSKLLQDSDFSFQEPVMALRTVIQEALIEKEASSIRKEYLRSKFIEHLMEFSKCARFAGNTQLAERAIFQIKQHTTAGLGSPMWKLEEAQMFWARKEEGLALGILRKMIHNLADKVDVDTSLSPMYAECLRLCGSWLAETCLESPSVILEKYLEKAVEIIGGSSDSNDAQLQSSKMKASLSLARFSDAQYQSIENYMKSSEFENKRALLEKAKQEVDLMKVHRVETSKYTIKIKREFELDEKALCNLKEDRIRFLCKAVENYINCLEFGEEHDVWVFRLCSLWLGNSAVSEVNSMVENGIRKIPSYKFLPLMYQLAARMGSKMPGAATEGVGFHDVLNEVICRTSIDHPHHTLFIILALVNADKDDTFRRSEGLKKSGLSKHAPKQTSLLDKERSEVAQEIVNVIRKEKAKMVKNVETLCEAYISLANMDASRWKTEKKPIPIPSDHPINKIKNLDDVIIPTMEIKVDPSGKYENIITIRSFRPEFHLVGGINLPKIIDCVGSDGKQRKQLVKGQDDLRQDAVMQQVFQMCNMLLLRNTETRKRKLTIRRYKVVPFSQRSGVLEWCTGTVPIGEYLIDPTKGAHKRYRPNDWSGMVCRRKMNEIVKKTFEDKLNTYLEVCQNFKPVFRYFCMERFLDPAVWLERRLAYTRSVATSSIVGYILGLGDRHVQNILIDEDTAELVHIDLGVAFEQGKILPTPETVPFRLSRDIVDGMGITGVEGVFRRCCEKTMEVMRNSQEALLTIVEVLLYDPLFDWTMNPLKAFYLQQRHEETDLNATLNSTIGEDQETNKRHSDTQSFNKVAERVLLRLHEKLKGVEEGAVLSVGGQVNLLIQQAMDPKNLSRLFPGWQPWI
ncbi:serine-protein kinase ATM [Erpetoichthys calabaricus]|uniref:non-specific serine/threonine protein kinase n=1 Tax=Erpetoichthys calabaricus TaxID=27687 RepID=A0A8C4S1Y9_ERPCA|nr:serine-protein kinase ATM [Erpetoichthys calabaricus]